MTCGWLGCDESWPSGSGEKKCPFLIGRRARCVFALDCEGAMSRAKPTFAAGTVLNKTDVFIKLNEAPPWNFSAKNN